MPRSSHTGTPAYIAAYTPHLSPSFYGSQIDGTPAYFTIKEQSYTLAPLNDAHEEALAPWFDRHPVPWWHIGVGMLAGMAVAFVGLAGWRYFGAGRHVGNADQEVSGPKKHINGASSGVTYPSS